ncbi:OVARIAN TUMOR DOMAIN-containing deubiquitinating enzyme 12-like [Rutidosis leptorrhynchoides]|uniref:OVARIAN TUMOR DOMAIN-containing deubiquitinating enzyme 12-like n=1 Tax=Rutidosis leptorrhynchoides TaxID=125765 RepID=UPI003A99A37D
MKMAVQEQDPDVVRWGLHHLMEVCPVTNRGPPGVFTRYDVDLSSVEYVSEGYCEPNIENNEISNYDSVVENDEHLNNANVENDEIIARAFQEELSRLAVEEDHGSSSGENHQKESVLAQNWVAPSKRHELENNQEQELVNEERLYYDEDQSCSPEMADESILDGEVGKRINKMFPIRHVPKVNGEMPTADEATSDHQRLMDRLQVYDLVELKVSGDGNCQFRSLSDQIYRSTEHHKLVREQVVYQLKLHPELYAAYVPMAYDEYLKKISTVGEWGDHVTLQAAADVFGVKIFVLTSFKDTCYIEILPCAQKSNRIIFLSFWAEVHYNSIYPEGELPIMESKKKKKWWMLGS